MTVVVTVLLGSEEVEEQEVEQKGVRVVSERVSFERARPLWPLFTFEFWFEQGDEPHFEKRVML